MSADVQLQVTSGKQWRKTREQGIPMVMPSGNVAAIRPLGVSVLLKTGKIPDFLIGVISDAVMGVAVEKRRKFDINDTEKLSALFEFQDAIAEDMFASPRIVSQPQADDEISIDDVALEDKAWLLQFIGAPIAALERFRLQQKVDVDAVGDVEVNGQSAESVGGDTSLDKEAL